MSFFSDFSDGMGLIESQYFGVSFTLTTKSTGSTSTYSGVFNSVDESQHLMLGGFEPGTAGVLVVRIVDVPIPAIGDVVTLNSESLRIMSIDKDEVSYSFTLANVNK